MSSRENKFLCLSCGVESPAPFCKECATKAAVRLAQNVENLVRTMPRTQKQRQVGALFRFVGAVLTGGKDAPAELEPEEKGPKK